MFSALLVGLAACIGQKADALLSVDFDGHPPGDYTREQANKDWKSFAYINLNGRAHIIKDGSGRSLRVTYPKGVIGPRESGAQFKVRLPARDECVLEYRVLFEPKFDFRRGGKLPGLAGGRANSGGNRPTGDGWSARFVWRRGGELAVYLYHPDQGGRYGDSLSIKRSATPGEWIRLRQRIKLNDGDNANGVLQVWVDGELTLDRRDIRYRTGGQAPIDFFLFSTFPGGSTLQWAPERTGYIRFDDFKIGGEIDRPANAASD